MIGLTDQQIEAIKKFSARLRSTGAADGVDPLNIDGAAHVVTVCDDLGNMQGLAVVTLDNELVSVMVDPAHRGKGIAHKLVSRAVANGATHLTCFDFQGLPSLYASHGFAEVERSPWNDDYAPENWNYDCHGRPDYLVMKLNESARG